MLRLAIDCVQVTARVLPSPRLEYGRSLHIDPGMGGDWNLTGKVCVCECECVVGGYVCMGMCAIG